MCELLGGNVSRTRRMGDELRYLDDLFDAPFGRSKIQTMLKKIIINLGG